MNNEVARECWAVQYNFVKELPATKAEKLEDKNLEK